MRVRGGEQEVLSLAVEHLDASAILKKKGKKQIITLLKLERENERKKDR